MTDFRPDRTAASIVRALDHYPDAIGPEILKAGRIRCGPGYAALLRLERAGWITSRWESPEPVDRPRHRVYRLEQPARDWLATTPAEPAAPPAGPETPRVDIVSGLLAGAFAGVVVGVAGTPIYGVITGIAITAIVWLGTAIINALTDTGYR